MKKRLIALSLVLMLALTLAIPSLAALTEAQGGNAGALTIDPNQLYDLGSSFTSYAFVKNDGLGKDIKWKTIKATDKTIDGKFDFSKIIKEPGVLFLGPASAATNPASLTSADYKKIEVSKVETKPEKPVLKGTGKISFADDATGTSITITVPAGTEYAPVNGQKWTPASGTSITIYLKGNKQDFWLRTKASTTTSVASPAIKFSVPAKAAAPKVSVDVAKDLVKVKDTWEFAANADATSWASITSGTKTMTIASVTSAVGSATTVYFRLAGNETKGKPPSAAIAVDLDLAKKEDVEEDNFVMAAKGVVLVTGDVIVEYKDGEKWKKAKKLTKDQVSTGLVVRIAGDKATLPSDEQKLKLTGTTLSLTT